MGTVPKTLDGANLTENADKLTDLRCERDYLLQYLKSGKFKKLVKSTQTDNAQPKLAIYALKSFEIGLPQKPEQQKIADYMGGVDSKLTSIQTKVAAMHEYKKGVMQALFSGKLRFKDENGNPYPDWEEKRLGGITTRITKKNSDNSVHHVLTNSATTGIVNQSDYFDKDIANQNNLYW